MSRRVIAFVVVGVAVLGIAGYFVYADLPYLLSHAQASWWQAGLD